MTSSDEFSGIGPKSVEIAPQTTSTSTPAHMSSSQSGHINPIDKNNVAGRAFRKIDVDGHNLPPSPAPSSPRSGRKYALATEIVFTEGNDQYNASSVPIYQVSIMCLQFF